MPQWDHCRSFLAACRSGSRLTRSRQGLIRTELTFHALICGLKAACPGQ